MQSVYFDHGRGSRTINPVKYLELVKKEYRTMYWQSKRNASKSDASIGFYTRSKTEGRHKGKRSKGVGGDNKGKEGGGGEPSGAGGGVNRWAKS